MYSFKITNPEVTVLLFQDFMQKGIELMRSLEPDPCASLSSDRPNKRLPGSEPQESTGTKRQRNRQGASASSLNSEALWKALKLFFDPYFVPVGESAILQHLHTSCNLIDYTATFSEQPVLLCLSKMLEQARQLNNEGVRECLAYFYGNNAATKVLASCDIYELFTFRANPAQSRPLVEAMILQHRSWLTELDLFRFELIIDRTSYLLSQVINNAIQLKMLKVHDTPHILQKCIELLGKENQFNVGINIISPQPNASHLPRMIPSLAMLVQHTMNALTTITLERVMIDEAAATGLGQCLNAASHLSYLELRDNQLTEAAAIALAAQLTRLKLITLILFADELVNEGARALLGALLGGGRLKNIKLSGRIELSSIDGILNNSALYSLLLDYGRSLNPDEMQSLLALPSLRELEMNSTMAPETSSVLTAALARNHPLTSLVLYLSDVASLIMSLGTNTCLQSLRVRAAKAEVEIPPEALIGIVNKHSLFSLYLVDLNLKSLFNCSASTALLAAAFANNRTITTLDLFDSIRNNYEKSAVLEILNALSEMIALTCLTINITWDEEFMVALCKILAANRLVSLNLRWSAFVDFSSFQLLGKQLESNTSLAALMIDNCNNDFEEETEEDEPPDELYRSGLEAILHGIKDNGTICTLEMDNLEGTTDLHTQIGKICELNRFNQQRKQSTLTGMLSSMFFGRRVSAERNNNESNPVIRM